MYSAYHYDKLVRANGDLRQIERHKRDAERELEDIYEQRFQATSELSDIQTGIEESQKEARNIQIELAGLHSSRQELNESLEIIKNQVQNQNQLLQEYQNVYDATQRMHEERVQKIQEETEQKIRLTEEECARIIGEKRVNAQRIVDQLEADAESERQKYLSIVATIASAQSEEEQNYQRHIKLSDTAQDDISYLLNNVVHHLTNPDILYKLIWSEYIQKPTNEMLDYILPQRDCAGIYKITNDHNKKSYIGRSTSVRKRLTDHVKSAVGISTIADQRIHQIMREEGLWNFTFQLIEECDRDKLSEREKYYIDFFQTAEASYGYNQKAGG